MKKLLKTIMEINPTINSISLIDVGARWGQQRPWNRFPNQYLSYYGFDADAEECQRLSKIKSPLNSIVYFPNALFDKDSVETLYLTKEKGCSSLYKPNYSIANKFYYSGYWTIDKEIQLETTTLKKILSKNNVKPDFLKIDTQGAELNILKGAGEYLDTILGLELEVEFVHFYEKQPLFSDVDSFVRSKGFELFDLNRYWGNRVNMSKYSINRGQLIFADAIYFRSIESFYSMTFDSADAKKEALLKMVSILALYGFFDVAIEYINHSSSPLTDIEIHLLEKNLCFYYPKWQKILLNNRFAGMLGKLFHLVGNLFSYQLRTFGWGTDYNAIDGRYLYYKKSSK